MLNDKRSVWINCDCLFCHCLNFFVGQNVSKYPYCHDRWTHGYRWPGERCRTENPAEGRNKEIFVLGAEAEAEAASGSVLRSKTTTVTREGMGKWLGRQNGFLVPTSWVKISFMLLNWNSIWEKRLKKNSRVCESSNLEPCCRYFLEKISDLSVWFYVWLLIK